MPTDDTRPEDTVVDDTGADDTVQDYLATLTGRCRNLLGADLVGVYAGGSLALHGFRPGRSDIDVAVVSTDALTDPQKHALVERLRQESLPCPARGLELVAYRAAVAAAGDPAPGFEVELNTGPRMAFRATADPARRPPADGLFWYAIDRSILAAHGRALSGPPAAAVFGSPPEPVLVQLLIESLRWYLASDTPVTDDAVLNACRALHRVRSGRWLAKPAAGRAILADPGPPDPATIERAPIEHALRAREGGPMPDQAAARRLQLAVLDVLRRWPRVDGQPAATG